MFTAETDHGIATARVNGEYIDAGRAGDIAGIEFSVDRMRMSDAPREQRHADAVVTLDCTPAVLLQMATVILTRLELPAFNAREWSEIAKHLHATGDEDARIWAEQIELAAAKIAAL